MPTLADCLAGPADDPAAFAAAVAASCANAAHTDADVRAVSALLWGLPGCWTSTAEQAQSLLPPSGPLRAAADGDGAAVARAALEAAVAVAPAAAARGALAVDLALAVHAFARDAAARDAVAAAFALDPASPLDFDFGGAAVLAPGAPLGGPYALGPRPACLAPDADACPCAAAPWAADPAARALAAAALAALPPVDLGQPAAARRVRALGRDGRWKRPAAAGLPAALASVFAARDSAPKPVHPDALGELLPALLPLVDDLDPAHATLGLALLRLLLARCPPTAVAWHRPLLLGVLDGSVAAAAHGDQARVALGAYVTALGAGPKPDAQAPLRALLKRAHLLSGGAETGSGNNGDAAAQRSRLLDALLDALPRFAALLARDAALVASLPHAVDALAPFLAGGSAPRRLRALRALHAVLCCAWPRAHAHAQRVLGLCLGAWRDADEEVAAGQAVSGEVRDHAALVGALVVALAGAAGARLLEGALAEPKVAPLHAACRAVAERGREAA